MKQNERNRVIIVDDASKIKQYAFEQWFSKNISVSDGIWIGKGIEDQELIQVNANSSNNPDSDEIVVTVKNGTANYLKSIR